MVMGETYRMVWDGVRLAHNPEVAGSNPAPATKASAAEGPDHWSGPSAVQAADLQGQDAMRLIGKFIVVTDRLEAEIRRDAW